MAPLHATSASLGEDDSPRRRGRSRRALRRWRLRPIWSDSVRGGCRRAGSGGRAAGRHPTISRASRSFAIDRAGNDRSSTHPPRGGKKRTRRTVFSTSPPCPPWVAGPGGCTAFRRGRPFTDRDQVDLCRGGHPRRRASILSCEKFGWPSLRRQQPHCQGSLASCTTRPIRIRSPRRIRSGTDSSGKPPFWMLAVATSDRGPEEKEASGRVHQALGRPVAAGAGTVIRVFSEGQDRGVGGGCLPGHIINMIAIGKVCPRRKPG